MACLMKPDDEQILLSSPAHANERFFSAQHDRSKAFWFSVLSATDIFGISRGASLVKLWNSGLIPYGWRLSDHALGRL